MLLQQLSAAAQSGRPSPAGYAVVVGVVALVLGLCLAELTRAPVGHRHRISTIGLVAVGMVLAGAVALLASIMPPVPVTGSPSPSQAGLVVIALVALAVGEHIFGAPTTPWLTRAAVALELGSVVGAVAVAVNVDATLVTLLAWTVVGHAGGVAAQLRSSRDARRPRPWPSLGILAGAALGLAGPDDFLALAAWVSMMALVISARVLKGSPRANWRMER